MDEAAARRLMVEGQLRPNRVTDVRLLAAFAALPRQLFVPPERRVLAHADAHVPLSPARVLLKPMVLARLVQALAVQPGERACVLAAGSGFGAALLAALGAEVVAVEADPVCLALARSAAQAVPEAARPQWVVDSPAGALANPAVSGPFDVMLIDSGAVPALPEAAAARLAEGGRIALLVQRGEGPAVGSLGRKASGVVSLLPLFDALAPLLPEFAPEPSFAF